MPIGVLDAEGGTRGGTLAQLNAIVLALFITLSLTAYRHLPARMPRHFNARGVVDSWTVTNAWSWFLLPGVAVALYVTFLLVGRLMLRRPEMVNLPDKSHFLQLPRAEQQPILSEIFRFMQLFNLVMLLMLASIQYATYTAAQGRPATQLMGIVLVVTVVLIPILTIVLLVRSTRQIGEAYRRCQMRGTLVRKA